MDQPTNYVRKPFPVKVFQVTEDNMETVSNWAKGSIRQDGDKKYIKVKVHQPKNERHTKAYLTDWVLLSEQGLKVYSDKAFKASFELAPDESAE